MLLDWTRTTLELWTLTKLEGTGIELRTLRTLEGYSARLDDTFRSHLDGLIAALDGLARRVLDG